MSFSTDCKAATKTSSFVTARWGKAVAWFKERPLCSEAGELKHLKSYHQNFALYGASLLPLVKNVTDLRQ